jgi:hypothetical protein
MFGPLVGDGGNGGRGVAGQPRHCAAVDCAATTSTGNGA